jgi:hypothetical protein
MKNTIRHVMVAGFSVVFGVVLAQPARADAIDGDWCSPEGKHVTIKGPSIKTPGGATIAGSYSRHAFSYVVPPSEAGGGETVYMTLMNETTAQVRNDTPVGRPTIWKRCENVS